MFTLTFMFQKTDDLFDLNRRRLGKESLLVKKPKRSSVYKKTILSSSSSAKVLTVCLKHKRPSLAETNVLSYDVQKVSPRLHTIRPTSLPTLDPVIFFGFEPKATQSRNIHNTSTDFTNSSSSCFTPATSGQSTPLKYYHLHGIVRHRRHQ